MSGVKGPLLDNWTFCYTYFYPHSCSELAQIYRLQPSDHKLSDFLDDIHENDLEISQICSRPVDSGANASHARDIIATSKRLNFSARKST